MDDIPLPPPVILDGATGTELRRRGMPPGVCTEDWILKHPDDLIDLQKAYVEAGAQVLLAPTFGANRAALSRYELVDHVESFNQRLVALSRQAAGSQAQVAADLSPTGLSIPPYGETSFEELVSIYTEQAKACQQAGVDLFCIETMISMPEARAAVLAVRSVSDLPIWVTFTCDEDGRTLSGTDVLAAMIVMQGMGVSAFGLNCSTDPQAVLKQLQRLTPYASVPLIAKPCAGIPEGHPGYTGALCPPAQFAGFVEEYAKAGVRMFGGCCGTGPDHIAAVNAAAKLVDFTCLPHVERDPDVIPCASETEARFITPDVDVGQMIECSPDLMEDILTAEEESPQGALKIAILEQYDLDVFTENQYAIKDALCLYSDVPELFEGALRAYQGRAFWDSTEELDPGFLNQMIQRYGLIAL